MLIIGRLTGSSQKKLTKYCARKISKSAFHVTSWYLYPSGADKGTL